MTKNDLIDQLAEKFNFVTKYQMKSVVDALFNDLSNAIQNGDKITINGFGSFQLVDTPERNGRNPHTGEALTIPAGKRLKFKASKLFKEEVYSPA